MKTLFCLLAAMMLLHPSEAQERRKSGNKEKTEKEVPETVNINKSGTRIVFTVGKTMYCYGVPEQKVLWATDPNNPYYPMKIQAPLFLDTKRKLVFECVGNFVTIKGGLVMLDAETGYYNKNLTQEVQLMERLCITPDEKYLLSLALGKLTSWDIASGTKIQTFSLSPALGNNITTVPGKRELLVLDGFDGSMFGMKSMIRAKTYDFEQGTVTSEQELDFSKELPVLDSCEFIKEPMNFSNSSFYIGYKNSTTGDVFTLVVNKVNYRLEEQFNFLVIKVSDSGAMLIKDKEGRFYLKAVSVQQPVLLDEINIAHQDYFGFNFSAINDEGTIVTFIQNNKVGFRTILNGQLSGITWIAY
jgi:hypothetical protein